MAETCGTTRGAGNNRAYEDAVNTRIEGDLQEVESDLPEDIRSVETRHNCGLLLVEFDGHEMVMSQGPGAVSVQSRHL